MKETNKEKYDFEAGLLALRDMMRSEKIQLFRAIKKSELRAQKWKENSSQWRKIAENMAFHVLDLTDRTIGEDERKTLRMEAKRSIRSYDKFKMSERCE